MLVSKEDVIEIIENENFTVDRKFERLKGLKGQSGEWINLNEAKEHFKYISSLDKEQILHILDRLPTATVEPKRGEWKEREVFDNIKDKVIEEWQSARCSECGKYHTTPYMYYFDNYNFCPNCGADMRGE